MTEEGRADPLNARAGRFRFRLWRWLSIVTVIVLGIVAGARLWRPVRTVERHVAAPIGAIVDRPAGPDRMADMVAARCPAIVSLHTSGAAGPAPQGVLISADGFVVTTAVLPAGAPVELWLDDGRRLPAARHGDDPLAGIALLKADAADLPALALAGGDLPRVGAQGAILSAPAGRGCVVAPAIVAADFATEAARDLYYVRVVAAGPPPPAGAPLLADDGRVLALAPAGVGVAGGDGRFVPADIVATVVSNLMRDGDPPPNPFGLIVRDLTPGLAGRLGVDRGRGAVVVAVGRGEAAARAGVAVGDIVLSAGQSPVSSASEYNRLAGGRGPLDILVGRRGAADPLRFRLEP